MEVAASGNYEKYPTGMGSRNWIDKATLREEATKLYELGRDSAKGKTLMCSIVAERNRRIAKERVARIVRGEWVKWEGRNFNKIYTDGSWKKENSVASLLLNTGKVIAGAG